MCKWLHFILINANKNKNNNNKSRLKNLTTVKFFSIYILRNNSYLHIIFF